MRNYSTKNDVIKLLQNQTTKTIELFQIQILPHTTIYVAFTNPKTPTRQSLINPFVYPLKHNYWRVYYGVISHASISPYSVRMQENTEKKTSGSGHFSRSEMF